MARHAVAEILALGMVTPVGLSAVQTAASVRTGIGRLGESYVTDRFGEPMVMGLVDEESLPPLVDELEDRSLASGQHRQQARLERLVRLGGVALSEALACWSGEPIPWLVGVGEARPEARSATGEDLLEWLSIQTGQGRHASSRTYPLGRVAGLVALQEALDLLDQRRSPAVLVGGVDSYLDLELLEALDREGRLRTGEISDGFVAGEGAAFLLVAPPGTGERIGVRRVARVEGIGRGRERGHLYSAEPHRGDGLASAFRSLFDDGLRGDPPPVGCIYAGLNGESYWAKEFGVAQIRCAERLADPLRIEHPVDGMGDAGAALGPIMTGLGALELARGRIEGTCLVWCAADRGDRVAVLLSA